MQPPTRSARDPAFDVPEVRRIQPRVDAAAEKLIARGVQPTVSLVRAEIGGGSPNAVAPALRHWRVRRDRALGRTQENDALPSPVIAAARTLYDAALEVASRAAGTSQVELAAQLESERAKSVTLAAELKHARRELETLRAERASVFEAAGRTHAELVQAQALATHCVGERQATQERLDATRMQLGEARSRIVALEATITDRATKTKTSRSKTPSTHMRPTAGSKRIRGTPKGGRGKTRRSATNRPTTRR